MPQWLKIILIIVAIFLALGLIFTILGIGKTIFQFLYIMLAGLGIVLIDIFKVISYPFRLLINSIREKKQQKALSERESYKWSLKNNSNKENKDENNHSM